MQVLLVNPPCIDSFLHQNWLIFPESFTRDHSVHLDLPANLPCMKCKFYLLIPHALIFQNHAAQLNLYEMKYVQNNHLFFDFFSNSVTSLISHLSQIKP